MTRSSDTKDNFAQQKELVFSLSELFEGEFSLDWLEELTALKASIVIAILEQGVEEKVLTRINPAVYLFCENVRKTWPDHLTPSLKERFHRHIATILIRELVEDDHKPLKIAHHLLHVSNDRCECQWLITAGETYTRRFQADKAMACFKHILGQLSHQSGESEDLLFIKAAVAYSNSYTGRAELLVYKSYLTQARERAKRLGRQSLVVLLEMHIAKHERLNAEFNQAIMRFERAFAQVEALADPELSTAATVFHTFFLFWQGRFQEVIDVYEQNLADVQKIPSGYFPILASVMVGHCYTMVGQVTQGLGMLDALRTYCLENKDRYLAAHATSCISMVMLSINRLDDAYRYLKLSYKEAAKTGNVWVKDVATLKLALIHHLQGEGEKAARYLRHFLKTKLREQNILQLYPYLMEIGWAIQIGDFSPVVGFSLEAEIERFLHLKNIFMKGIAYRYEALLAIRNHMTHAQTQRSFNLSVKWLKASGHQMELVKTFFELARFHLALSNPKKAKSILAMVWDLLSSKDIRLIPEDLRSLIDKGNRDGFILGELLAMADLVASRNDQKKFLQHLLAAANRITGAERGALLLVHSREGNSYDLQLRASRNLTSEQMDAPGFAACLQRIRTVIDSGQGRIFDTASDKDAAAAVSDTIRSGICVPLLLRGEAIGALYHDNRLIGHIFKESDLKLLTYLAAIAALDLNGEKGAGQLAPIDPKEEGRESLASEVCTPLNGTEGFIGASPAFGHLLAQIDQVAATDTAILITGETGVGKNVIATVLHRQSRRSAGPFVTVQCNAFAEGLITSELFGHEKGAFTGAVNRHIGRFELADGGTLFLDEIGDLSLEVQSRLLRVLQSKEFERVGGGPDILLSDFRLVAATNKNLEQEVLAGRFRQDLYYRINVFPLHVPPLRERREDIPVLADYFLKLANARQNKPCGKLSQASIQTLMRHEWPGNIRELENVIQRGVISSNDGLFHLPRLNAVTVSPVHAQQLDTLVENERKHILEALRRSWGKVHGPAGAAEMLGVNAYTLTSRMKKLGITRAMGLS